MQFTQLEKLKGDDSWAFSNLKKKETSYLTHGYHRYPAKFIPQIVKKLMLEYSEKGEVVLDPFGGCGTTLVEAKLNERKGIGIDVNKVAILIAKTKIKTISSKLLEKKSKVLLTKILKSKVKKNFYDGANSRLRYWFKPNQFNKLNLIYEIIQKEKNENIRLFYNCCFSNILKNCSIWYSKSIKPMRDLSKKSVDPLEEFTKHLMFMIKQNRKFIDKIKEERIEELSSKMLKRDARKTGLPDNSIDLIITSPPYVVSYDYADLHQLSLIWFKFGEDIREIKKDFIGSSMINYSDKICNSRLAQKILKELKKKDKTLSKKINKYFLDIEKSLEEMSRVLKKDKYLCLIIGNTEYKGIKILNTEVCVEMLNNLGFKITKVIKRKLSSKTFTPYRDKEGKFTTSSNGGKRRIYQYEYIVIAKK